MDLWRDANVIQVRIGDQHLYFNDHGEQILTDEPDCRGQGVPYWDGMGKNHMIAREIVDHVSDNHTYVSKADLVRIDHKNMKDVALMLENNCERIPMRAVAIMLYTDQGSLSELKQLIESHDWKSQGDPYGGCFFGYCNMRYSAGRPWEETEKILNYMYGLGHKPQELVECVVNRLQYNCDTPEEMDFWEKCAAWALGRSKFPNKLQCGKTCYDEYLETCVDSKPKDIQRRIRKLGEIFLAHGARIGTQQAAYHIQKNESYI